MFEYLGCLMSGAMKLRGQRGVAVESEGAALKFPLHASLA